MGYGEEYYNQFYKWFSRLDSNAQITYAADNPEPDDWAGIYERIKSHPWL